MASHKSIKRIVHRCIEEVKATCEVAKYTSYKDAAVTFLAKLDIQRMNHNGYYEPAAVKKRLLKKHEVMLRYFETKYAEFLKDYNYDRELPQDDPTLRNRIWVCWWQGVDNAPELVKKCMQSLVQNAGPYQVTVITEKNYKEYVHIPQWVEQKFQNGIITRTNYSDLLRLSLLAEHGGLWLDATFLCNNFDPEECLKKPLWSIKRPDYLHCSVAGGYFAGYSLACKYENRWVFATIRDFFLHYWQENNMLVDYLLIDYMIALAQRKDPRIKAMFADIRPNNPLCDDLSVILGQPFDMKRWKELKQDTSLFKLTWKQEFPIEKDGKKTFYGMLLEGKL